MSDNSEPTFLVDAYSEPAIVRVNGKASYLNSSPLRDFFRRLQKMGKKRIVLDLMHCTSMDSTFLGIMAGGALEMRKQEPQGKLILCRLGSRNLELIRNLGLHRIMEVDCGDFQMNFSDDEEALPEAEKTEEIEAARMILKAHEDLVSVNEENRSKFQDVLSFLKMQVDSD